MNALILVDLQNDFLPSGALPVRDGDAVKDSSAIEEKPMNDYLQEQGVRHVCVLGLATDYCVKFTALDARQLGFAVTLVASGCRAVDLKPGDGEHAIRAMRDAGAHVVDDLGQATIDAALHAGASP